MKTARTYKLECGCICYAESERLFQMCPQCNAEWRELHARAIKDYRDTHPVEDILL